MILVIDNHSALRPQIESWLACVPHIIKGRDEEWGNIDAYDAIILTGGHDRSVVDHERFYKRELALIREFGHGSGRLIGICLGFELIAYAYGSTLRHLAEKEAGDVEVTVIKADPIFNGISRMKVFESHHWVIDALGEGLEVLARSYEGIEAIRHAENNMYGFQFHPEMIRDEVAGRRLLSNLLTTAMEGATSQVGPVV